MATAHLVCGFLGAGKSRFAEELAATHAGVRFSIDELYLQLFADGPTYELDEDAMARLLAATEQIWPQVLAAGVDVILDFGFWNRSLRDQVRARADSVRAGTHLYWLQCPDRVAIQRCLRRNGRKNAFLISSAGFYALKPRFQEPGPDEAARIVNTDHPDHPQLHRARARAD